jgi:hypothetical protein
MHWSWRIVRKNANPLTIPPMDRVNIAWAHDEPDGKYSKQKSIEAAREMVNGFDNFDMQTLGAAPALKSRHTKGCAIDMAIRWNRTLSIVDARGLTVEIATMPRTGVNLQLRRVGESYGVIKYNRGGRARPALPARSISRRLTASRPASDARFRARAITFRACFPRCAARSIPRC